MLNNENDCEFHAQRSTGISSQQIIAKTGSSKLYKTTGMKPQLMAYLITPCSSSDPISDLYDQLDRLTAQQPTKAKPRLRGRKLLEEPLADITFSQKDHTIDMHLGIDLACTPDYQNQLIKLMQKVSQCFVINQTSLVPRRN